MKKGKVLSLIKKICNAAFEKFVKLILSWRFRVL